MDGDSILFDLILAWNWEYDQSFLRILDQCCQQKGLTFLAVSPANLSITLERFSFYPFQATAFLDRALESDDHFLPLTSWAKHRTSIYLNSGKYAVHANDKAAVHYDLIKAGLHTPYTIVLPPFSTVPDVSQTDFTPLGAPFVAKPSHGGGSEGVVLQVWSFDQIQQARQQFSQDAFLLQAQIHPAWIDSRRAWFRSIYCCREVFVNWWDMETHVYTPVKIDPESTGILSGLPDISKVIADTLHMDIFSSEIALTEDGSFIVVDYLNDPIDLRLQSEAIDGVPDEIVRKIADLLTEEIIRCQNYLTI
jgi:hypothetical protein